MFIKFIEDSLKQNSTLTAVVYRNKEYSFSYIYDKYIYWLTLLEESKIVNTIVVLMSDFNPDTIALVLALIAKNNIFVPLSLNVKIPEKLIQISEAMFVLTLIDNKIQIEPKANLINNKLLKDIIKKNHPGLVLFSSGTTGEPKGAVHDLVPLLEKYKKPGKTLRAITFLLFDHIGGFNTLLHMISNGGTIVIIEDRSVDSVCKIIEDHKVELLPTTPTFLNMILFSRAYKKYDLSSLQMITYGTENMPKSTLISLNSIFPKIKLKQTYGLSEVGIMSSKSESSDSLWLKIGGADFKTKIVDDILYIKSKTAMKGYLNADSPFDKDGWFNTQDKVEVKGEYIRFLGRVTDIINVGGEKVYPADVESVLLDHYLVDEASVYGEVNAFMGNIVVADISCSDDNISDSEIIKEIRNYCLQKMEKYKVPLKINIKSESLVTERFKRKRN